MFLLLLKTIYKKKQKERGMNSIKVSAGSFLAKQKENDKDGERKCSKNYNLAKFIPACEFAAVEKCD